jgi:lipoic acid synthetase
MSVRTPKPSWIRVPMPGSPKYHELKDRARTLKLATVCEEARCPNIGECWSTGTATFMVMGDTCTRGCRFCAVKTAKRPAPLDPDEPVNLALAIQAMDLDYVVVTSVNRDELPDGGASHFAACITETRRLSPRTMIEVLVPDFQGNREAVATLVGAGPDVVAHNVETVERLTPTVRDRKATYRQSLDVLGWFKEVDPTRYTKSSIMVGVGETEDEILATMRDLRSVGVDFLTIGQYLQPTTKHLAITEFVTPERFDRLRDLGLGLGFGYVASGPLVRSSYKAGEFFIRDYVQKRRDAAPTDG